LNKKIIKDQLSGLFGAMMDGYAVGRDCAPDFLKTAPADFF
jgi:hypothetical protein